MGMSAPMEALFIFVIACIIGYHVIWNVTPALHTPLMSITNAISGIILVGCILVTATEGTPLYAKILGVVGIVIASVNIFGGFTVTQRMLGMYKRK